MFTPGDLVDYRHDSGIVRCRVIDIIPDIDYTYYSLEVTSLKAQWGKGTELMIKWDSPRLRLRKSGNVIF